MDEPYSRMDNGVKSRFDAKGDGWANAHRLMGQTFNMNDVDALFGMVAFGQNCANRLFAEYVPDSYSNRPNLIRSFALVCLFDRKSNINAALCDHNRVSSAFYLWLCRQPIQPKKPMFFYVIGEEAPPWTMLGIDLDTGQQNNNDEILRESSKSEFMRVWDKLGLSSLRNELRSFIDPMSRNSN